MRNSVAAKAWPGLPPGHDRRVDPLERRDERAVEVARLGPRHHRVVDDRLRLAVAQVQVLEAGSP